MIDGSVRDLFVLEKKNKKSIFGVFLTFFAPKKNTIHTRVSGARHA
jgi:hypothetical protein|tara:strand:- start:11059 stop:11196 length:138 start_codon:yes stop_codon:yes gene_type:complete